MKQESGPNSSRNIKEQALGLLEWALEDMSPDAFHRLHIKCGFEREGHFIPAKLTREPPDVKWWEGLGSLQIMDTMEKVAEGVSGQIHDPRVQRIYHDTNGTFMLEAVTQPLGLLEATRTVDSVSREMVDKSANAEVGLAHFGSLPVDDLLKRMGEEARRQGMPMDPEHAITMYDHEIFNVPGKGKTLVGRGQHCNLSVWMGDANLFTPLQGNRSPDIVNHAVEKSLEWLPSMFITARDGNYSRIAAGSKTAVHTFSAEKLGRNKTGHILRYTESNDGGMIDQATAARLEFRQGASDADPFDLALASAAPLVKACDEALQKKDGKAVLDGAGKLEVSPSQGFPSNRREPVPTSEAAAAAIFARPENPYFDYLNTLAERKISRAQQEYDQAPDARHAEELRSARKMEGIGTKLRGIYMKGYDIGQQDHARGGRNAAGGMAAAQSR